MNRVIYLFLLFSILLYSKSLVEYDYELDLYYTNVSAFISLDKDKNITDATHLSETQIYSRLLSNITNPNIFLIEAAVNPMGIAGVYIKKNHREFYEDTEVGSINMTRALTAGFNDPASLSFFIGRMMIFKNKKSDRIGKNRAFVGTLFSIGNYSIKSNTIYDDYWKTIEFKLKGIRAFKLHTLDWSFRIGATIHQNYNFSDTIYIGARRNSVDFTKKNLSLIYNSDFDILISTTTDTFELAEFKLTIGKTKPISWPFKSSIGFKFGYLYNSYAKYKGKLKDEWTQNHQIIFQPNIKW